jgi:hypothetical protein
MSAARDGDHTHANGPDRFSESMDRLMSREIAETFPGQWVAVYDGKVVGSSTDPDALLSKLRSSRVPIEETAIKYIAAGKLVSY